MEELLEGSFKLLHPRVRRAAAAHGYRKPTPVQELAIPVVLRGVDALIVAPTGSGKTEAALFPAMSRVADLDEEGVKIVYVTPLRSLNRDLFERMCRVAEDAGFKLMVRHGDSSQLDKRAFLERPPDIMVTTPETLYFLLSVSRFREVVRPLRIVVVDELHEMLDDKRGAELALALERLEEYVGRRLQRIGLSATVRDARLAARMLAPGRIVEIVDASWIAKKVTASVVSPAPGPQDQELAKMLGVESPYTAARVRFIAETIKRTRGGVLVFTNTRDTAEVLGALLKKVLGDDAVLVHHGSLSREERVRAERLFREGKVKAIVATSSLELGIDIGHVELVIQYMSPRQAQRLLQRVGRAGHRLGLESRGIVVASENVYDILESAVIAARTMRGDLEPQEPYSAPYDVLAHQLAGAVAESGEVSLDWFYWVARRTLPFESLCREELEAVARHLESVGVIKLDGSRARKGRRLYSYYYSVTMIPDTAQYPVYDTVSGERIGVLDEDFVATLEEGELFVLAGRVWEVVSVDERAVRVRPAKSVSLLPPAWEGDLIPVDWRVAREVGSILRRYASGDRGVLDRYPMDESAKRRVAEVLDKHLSRGLPVPSDKQVVVEAVGDVLVFHAFLGSRGSKALELALSMMVKQVLGYTPWTASTPYAVVVRLAGRASAEQGERLLRTLASLPPEEVEELVREAARRTRLYEWKLHHVAQRMGVVERGAKPDRRMLKALVDTVVGEEALKELMHDKVDLEPLLKLLRDIREGRVSVAAVNLREPSPLASEVLGEARVGDRVAFETVPSTVLAEVVKRRLARRRLRLVCLFCAHVWEAEVGSLEEEPRCPSCGSGFIAPTRLEPAQARELVRRMRRGERLAGDEAKVARELKEAANLVLSYGRRALEAMAATGVGPATAKQVLRKLVFGEESYYRALVEAEQRYLRTRRYWR